MLVVLVSGGALVARGAGAAARAPTGTPAPTDPISPSLVVNSSGPTVPAGSSAVVSAGWEGIPSGCAATPLWFRWSLPAGADEGTLGPSEGPNVTFTAITALGGPVTVAASSGLELECNASARIATANASTGLFVDAPPVLEGLTVGPNPIVPGDEVNLSATVANGEPPFAIEVAWGDGSSSALEVAHPGAISIAHRYPAGTFTPSVRLTDRAGSTVAATVDEAISASAGAALAIDAPDAPAGVPVEFEGILDRPPADFTSEAFCDGQPAAGQWSPDGGADEDRFTCVFAGAGVDDVDLTVFPLDGEGTPVGAQLAEPVVAPLEVNLSAPAGPLEVGQPSSAGLWIAGGAPPVVVNWALGSTAAGDEVVVPSDGSVGLPIVPDAPGNESVVVRTGDPAVGGGAAESLEINVSEALAGRLSTNGSLAPDGELVSIFGNVTGGVPPFSWWLVPATGAAGPPGAMGGLSSDGPFSWQGLYALEGTSDVEVAIADVVGAVWSGTVAVPLVPPLEVGVEAAGTSNASGRFVELNVAIEGGLPPFDLEVNASGNATWNATAAADGLAALSFACNETGALDLRITVEDLLGATAVDERTVELPGPDNATGPPASSSGGSPPSGSSGIRPVSAEDGYLVTAVAVLLLVAAFLAAWVRRRRRTGERPSAPRPDPAAVIRGIVEPAEGAERATVELLAEEAGVPAEEVRATIDRLIADGSLRSETGSDGEEVLAWSDPD